MSDATSCAELDGQHVELLPSRTLLSLLSVIDLDTGGTPGVGGAPGAGVPSTAMLLSANSPISSPVSVGEGGSASSGRAG